MTEISLKKSPTLKEELISYLQTLPDEVTLEDVMYHLYVRKKIQQGLEDGKAGRTYTHEEMKEIIKSWKK